MTINYQAIVAIESVENFNFLNGRSTQNETPSNAAPWINTWEHWEILKYSNVSDDGAVHFGDVVSFRNVEFDRYMSGYPDYAQVTTMDAMQDFERWILVDPNNSSSTAAITNGDDFLLQLANNNGSHYARVNGGDVQSSVPLNSQGTLFRLVQLSVGSV
jgi:hypothetical protein